MSDNFDDIGPADKDDDVIIAELEEANPDATVIIPILIPTGKIVGSGTVREDEGKTYIYIEMMDDLGSTEFAKFLSLGVFGLTFQRVATLD